MENGISSLVKPVSYEETLASLPPRRSPYEAFSYLLQPPSVRDRAPAQPAPSPPIEIAPMPMPTDPIAGQPMPTQPPSARPPLQTDPMPQPDPMPIKLGLQPDTPETFVPTVPIADPIQPERPDPIIDTKPTPTTLAELEAMLGIRFDPNYKFPPRPGVIEGPQERIRRMAAQFGITLPAATAATPPVETTPPVGTTPPTNMPAPGTVINLPFGGSFTIPNDIQERIDAAKAAQAGTTPPLVTTPTTPSLPPVGTTIPFPFGGGLTVTQDMQDRINAAKAAAETATTTTPRANIATTTSPMVGGRRGLMSKEAIENLRRRVQEMRTPPPTPVVEEDSLQRSIDNLRDIFGRASEGEDRSSGPTDTRDPRRLPRTLPISLGRSKLDFPTLPINVGQQRAPQLPMPRRLPTVPPPKPARRQIPVNTDKQDMVRRALSERVQNVGRLLGRGRGR